LKVILIILDGWGIAENPAVSAIDAANVHFYRHCLRTYPHTRLQASEQAVGLPVGQMGNSEVGHINLGAGRIVYQELERISRAFRSGEFEQLPAVQQLITYCLRSGKPLHLLGLVSDGGVHSHIDHLKGLLAVLAGYKGFPPVYIHAFTDGRDTSPHSGIGYISDIEDFLSRKAKNARIASICGRYYAMDRDNRWERTAQAWKLLVKAAGKPFEWAAQAFEHSYNAGITDEFLPPVIITDSAHPPVRIAPEDAVIFFNFRTDRGRQLTQALTQTAYPDYEMYPLPLQFATFSRYDEKFKDIAVIFEKKDIHLPLGEVLAQYQKKQIRIAETEKYPHVTFFFNGGREDPFAGERRILCNSPKVATYDLAPEMSAFAVRDAILPEIIAQSADFICLNFANPDMVGHTGVFEAAVKACEVVDSCTKQIAEAAAANGWATIILSDHGNVDKMRNPDNSPHTAHTLARVPCIFIPPHSDKHTYKLQEGILADIAPTILSIMGLPIPSEMTGKVLLSKL
jgi:2,3-bisphosphoglycerate-independent phosphoglycerate mutase